MFFVAMDSVKPGDVVARAIYDGREMPLVAAGAALSKYEIERLKILGFQGVYITESSERQEEPRRAISDAVRNEAVEQMSSAFATLERGGVLAIAPLQSSIDAMLEEVLGAHTIITSLTNLRTHDNYTFEHSVNVAAVAMMIGGELGLEEERLRVLGLGALLHDVGKTLLSPTILRKPGGLTEVEYQNVQEHPRLGFEILKTYKDLEPTIAEIAYQHHERLDGKGYPRGLRASRIDPLAKIVTVSDVYDALTADRVYRKGMPTSKVLDILQKDVGTAFDPDSVAALLRRVAPYPLGTVVRLSTGVVATVVAVPQDDPGRPSVRVQVDAAGNVLSGPVVYHLRHDPTLHIEDVLVS